VKQEEERGDGLGFSKNEDNGIMLKAEKGI